MADGIERTGEHGDERVIGLCLRAVIDTALIPEWEFHTLFGLDRAEVEQIAAAWPALPESTAQGYDSPEDAQRTAVNNALSNLLGYPHGMRGDEFERVVGVREATVADALRRWRGDASFDPSGKGHFDRLM